MTNIDPQLFFYIVTTSIQALVIACDEFLYALVIDLYLQSIYTMLDCVLHFLIACEVSASFSVGEK
jgi:cellulose synthase/poly-beta-1,6-N-acetylglucosamine synthase-like glycosyltransferase